MPKGTVEKVLQSLSESTDGATSIRSKEYGKLKLFWSEEANLHLSYTKDDLDALEDKISAAKTELETAGRAEKDLKSELAELVAEPTDADLSATITVLSRENEEKRRRLDSISSGVAIDPQAMSNAVQELNYYRGSWVRRKAQCIEVVDMLSESMEKKRKEVEGLLGLEGDEGLAVPEAIKL